MDRFPTLSAFPITPCEPDGRVDRAALRRLLEPLAAAKVGSVGLLGSTGSYPYLTREERRRALDVALEVLGTDTPALVGVGALRTDEAVRLAQDARAAGAAAGLLAAVSYTPLTDDEVFEHFSIVARESGLPLHIYDNPATTHFTFGHALVGRLSRVEGIVAVKCPAPEPHSVAAHYARMRDAVPERFSLGYSVDWHAAEALLAGGETWYSVAGGLFPQTGMALVGAAARGDADALRGLNERLQPLWSLFKAHSSLRVMYAAADLLGVCRATPPRPVLPLAEAARQQLAGVLKALDLR